MVKTTKQSKLDWSIYAEGKIIGHITKNYLKGKSGPYTFQAKAIYYIKGKRFPELDYTWEVVRTFQVAKLLIIKYMKDEFYA